MRADIYEDGEDGYLAVPKNLAWDWLKAERRYKPQKEKLQVIPNRAARRRMGLKRIF